MLLPCPPKWWSTGVGQVCQFMWSDLRLSFVPMSVPLAVLRHVPRRALHWEAREGGHGPIPEEPGGHCQHNCRSQQEQKAALLLLVPRPDTQQCGHLNPACGNLTLGRRAVLASQTPSCVAGSGAGFLAHLSSTKPSKCVLVSWWAGYKPKSPLGWVRWYQHFSAFLCLSLHP